MGWMTSSSAEARASRANCSCNEETAASSSLFKVNPGWPTRTTTTGVPCSSTPTATGCRTCTAAVAAGDFTGDGRLDLFVGGRLTPRNYPYPTRSYLLRNDGGHFTDVTAEVAPELSQPSGMITAAVWMDVDGDGRLDLVTAGEWMPLQVFRNEGTRFR